MAIRRRNLSSPLAVSEFDDDKPKRKSKQKRENRKAVRQLKKKTTTRTITRGMSPDGKGGGPNSRVTKPSKSSSGGGKSSTEKKSKLDKKIIRAKKRGRNPEYIKKKAEEKAQKKREKEGRKSFRGDNLKLALKKMKKNPQNKKINVESGCGPGKLYNKKSCSAKNRSRIN